MRDIAFMFFLLFLLHAAFRKPFIAVSIMAWSSLFVLVDWLYGFAALLIRYNLTFALIAILMCIRFKDQLKFQANTTVIIIALFFFHVFISSQLAVAPEFLVEKDWSNFWKAILLFFMITLVLNKKNHFLFFTFLLTISIGATGVIEALKWVNSGFFHQAKGPGGHILSDNNHFAIALCTILPLANFAREQFKNKWVKRGMLVAMLLIVFAILSTQSRGGVITLFFISLYFWWKSTYKLKLIPVYGVVLLLVFKLMGQSWMDRMNTVKTADQDSSFTTRVAAWKINHQVALQNPFFGLGFKGPQLGEYWNYYAQFIDKDSIISINAVPTKAYAAHSIYFQVLGEQGLVGFVLYVGLFVSAFVTLSNIRRSLTKHKEYWQFKLASMLQVSLFAFAFGGLTISIAYIDLVFIILALPVALSKQLKILKAKSASPC